MCATLRDILEAERQTDKHTHTGYMFIGTRVLVVLPPLMTAFHPGGEKHTNRYADVVFSQQIRCLSLMTEEEVSRQWR